MIVSNKKNSVFNVQVFCFFNSKHELSMRANLMYNMHRKMICTISSNNGFSSKNRPNDTTHNQKLRTKLILFFSFLISIRSRRLTFCSKKWLNKKYSASLSTTNLKKKPNRIYYCDYVLLKVQYVCFVYFIYKTKK